ncbi:transposase [Methylobacterium aquaticum]|uniref:transposase n=1 Tax=Methylobacterium aquaticum TaxID=270351 RepID=UPI003CC9C9BC
MKRLTTIPGISDLTAQVFLSEIGPDMNRFPTAGHLISRARLCPRSDKSAGKRPSTRLRKARPGSRRPWSRQPGQGSQEGEPPQGAVPASAQSARSQEGDLRPGRLDAHCNRPHAQDRHGFHRFRARSRPQGCTDHPRQGAREADRAPRMRLRNQAWRARFYCDA